MTILSKEEIYKLLEEVMDPEIPTISLVDLGIVTDVQADEKRIMVTLTPTFSGCPALKVMEELVSEKIKTVFDGTIEVRTNYDQQWHTDLITEKGRRMLLKHGLAPPPKHEGYLELEVLSDLACPRCGSRHTEMRSPFGPTLCRSLHYCKNCLNAFEGFKPLV